MATAVPIVPVASTPYTTTTTTHTTQTTVRAPTMPTRQDSLATVDMHIPGAWVGTNPSTPAPISEDIKYFGEQLKTLPATVQTYIPKNEDGTPVTATLKDKAAALIPAGALNTAAAYLPTSLNPTLAPTAADAPVPVTNAAPHIDQPLLPKTNLDRPATNKQLEEAEIKDEQPKPQTWTETAASVVPAGVAAYLPNALNPNSPSDTAPTSIADKGLNDEQPKPRTWSETAASVVPAGVAAYLPNALNPNAPSEGFHAASEGAPTPFGEHEGLNGPLPPIPTGPSTSSQPLMGSTVSPDQDAQQALANSSNPEHYKTEIPLPAHLGSEKSIVESTQAVGGRTPLTPASEIEGDGYPAKGKKGVSGIPELSAGVGIGAFATDHALKDQKEAAIRDQHTARPADAAKPQDSFTHVVIPATPGAGLHEQEQFINNDTTPKDSSLSPEKKHKKNRSGSMSAGEASPSSPSKGMFGGIRKLTKKRDRSASKGAHSRDVSADETGVLVADTGVSANTSKHRDETLDSQHSGSSGGGTSPVVDRKAHNVLHKDPPATYQNTNAHINDSANVATIGSSPHTNNTAAEMGAKETTPPLTHDAGATMHETGTKEKKSSMMSNPFYPGAPSSSSPTKVGFKDKIKGEFMVVQGVLSRDEGLKEAGSKLKKGTH